MEHVVTQVSWPDESKYRPGMVVEVPAAAFGETYAAEHASETFTGTLLDVHRVEDGAILWNVRYGDGDCVTDEAFFDEEDEPDDERANVCACCGGTTVTATPAPSTATPTNHPTLTTKSSCNSSDKKVKRQSGACYECPADGDEMRAFIKSEPEGGLDGHPVVKILCNNHGQKHRQ